LNVRKTGSDARGDDHAGCFIFNVYGHKLETPWCKHHHITDVDSLGWKREGWKGLDKLAADIRERAIEDKVTHIILLATGWNTRQYESYLDFLAWMNNVTEDFKKENVAFRPLFVGTTWESEWPLWERLPFFSAFTKGNDADEIGFTWENYLLNEVIKPIAKTNGAQLTVIGHSFGTRIALGAHYVRHIQSRGYSAEEVPITLIGMQAAFPIARFVTSKGKEHHYVAANKGSATVIITSSEHDEATGRMCIGTAYVGAGCGLKKLKQEKTYRNFAAVLPTSDNGEPRAVPDSRLISVYDASPFINCEARGTKSGAHSDVYDDAMGHFLGEIIRNSTSSKYTLSHNRTGSLHLYRDSEWNEPSMCSSSDHRFNKGSSTIRGITH
jgi:hypothetical protein